MENIPQKELKKFGRSELLEIIMLQNDEADKLRKESEEALRAASAEQARLTERIAELEQQLADKTVKLSSTGNIAEASLAMTNLFMEAEKAVSVYKTNIERLSNDQERICREQLAETEQKSSELLKNAESEASAMLAKAKAESESILSRAKREADSYWDQVSQKLESFYSSHAGLRELLSRSIGGQGE